MFANRIAVKHVDTARPDESVWLAAERMHQRGVGALVVVNEGRVPIGILTDRDLVERVLTKRLNLDATPVTAVMTKDLMTIHQNGSIEAALLVMREGQFRRLPIVDDQGCLTGLVCLDDILMYFAHEFTAIGQLLRTETPRAVAEEALVEA
jgi:CBS domain-containing protein